MSQTFDRFIVAAERIAAAYPDDARLAVLLQRLRMIQTSAGDSEDAGPRPRRTPSGKRLP